MMQQVIRKCIKKIIKGTVDPLKRRKKGGVLDGLSASFFKQQNEIVSSLLVDVYKNSDEDDFSFFPSMLESDIYSRIGERIIEYPWVLWELVKIAGSTEDSGHILDVGCVLNSNVIENYIKKHFSMIWFLNPGMEKIVYKKNVAYFLSDIREHRLPVDLKFDAITSLSTIEHIGMDTRRYGGPGGEVNVDYEQPQKNAVPAVNKMCDLLKPGGSLLISVPFGPFEYVYDHKGGPEIYYVFDKERLESLIRALPENMELSFCEIYKVIPYKKWVKTDINDKDIPLYAEGCAGAAGVALLKIVHKGKIKI